MNTSNEVLPDLESADQNGIMWLSLLLNAAHKAFLIQNRDTYLAQKDRELLRYKLDKIGRDIIQLGGATVTVASAEDSETLAKGRFVLAKPNDLKIIVKPDFGLRQELVYGLIVNEPARRFSTVEPLITLSTELRYKF